jgi:hypothetical protein
MQGRLVRRVLRQSILAMEINPIEPSKIISMKYIPGKGQMLDPTEICESANRTTTIRQ